MENRPWFQSYEPRVPHTIDSPDTTLDTLLADSARAHPGNTATHFVLSYLLHGAVTVGGKLSYHKLNELATRFAAALYQLGVRKGDRVALMLPNSPQFIIAFFGAMKIGAIIVNNNPTYTARELKHQIDDSGAETIVVLNLFWPRVREIQAKSPLKRVIITNIFDTLPLPAKLLVGMKQRREPDWIDMPKGPGIYSFQKLLDLTAPALPVLDVLPNDTALLQYTGGTTGLPKAAMLTHRNLLSNALQTSAWIPAARKGEESFMLAIPFFHVYGMTVGMLLSICLSARMVIVPNPRPIDNVMAVIQKERCSFFPGVPAMYIGIVNHTHVANYDLASIKACISGSAPLPMEIQERFGQITGGRLVEGFGLTEASPVTHCNPVYGTRKSGSIGIPLPSTDAKIIDMETGADLLIGSDQQGELCIRGPQVMKGYWKRPEDTKESIDAEGWLHTGDICKIDSDGYFYIVDRKKDMINASGFKVLPRDVEEVLYMHPQVLEAVVLGVPNPARGDDTVKAYIVPRNADEQPSAEEIKAFCRQQLAPYKVPREIEFRKELPKTIVGKVLRRVLLAEEQSNALAKAPTPPLEKETNASAGGA